MPGAGNAAVRAFDRIWAGRAARWCARVLAVSRSVADHMVELGVEPGRIDVATNGVDFLRFRPKADKVFGPGLRAVIVGRLTPTKGPMHALEAVAQARATGRDVHLTVVGDGPLEARLRRRAQEPDLAGAVNFTGRVDHVEDLLRSADVALRPSYTEGLPLAVIEALACGLPVVCSAVPGNVELVEHDVNGIIVPIGGTAAMAAALVRLHDDVGSLRLMSQAAAASASSYTWTASAEAHLTAFERVLSLSRTGVV